MAVTSYSIDKHLPHESYLNLYNDKLYQLSKMNYLIMKNKLTLFCICFDIISYIIKNIDIIYIGIKYFKTKNRS